MCIELVFVIHSIHKGTPSFPFLIIKTLKAVAKTMHTQTQKNRDVLELGVIRSFFMVQWLLKHYPGLYVSFENFQNSKITKLLRSRNK